MHTKNQISMLYSNELEEKKNENSSNSGSYSFIKYTHNKIYIHSNINFTLSEFYYQKMRPHQIHNSLSIIALVTLLGNAHELGVEITSLGESFGEKRSPNSPIIVSFLHIIIDINPKFRKI